MTSYEWVVLPTWGRLHAVPLRLAAFAHKTDWYDETECGRPGTVQVPGVLSRLELPRCKVCCKRTGTKQGVGDPKNGK